MEIKKSAFLLALFITISLFLTLLLISDFLGGRREDNLNARFNEVYRDFDDLQQIMLMSDVYGNEMACIAYKNKLSDFDKRIWDLGLKLEQYRTATEEFRQSLYYLEQKKIFNENEFTYLALLKQIKKLCSNNQTIISFFYRNSKDCKKCDDQSFVLSDIKKRFGNDVAIFSYDLDLNITSLELLRKFYSVDEVPCVIIDERKFCGMQSHEFIVNQVCQGNNLLAC